MKRNSNPQFVLVRQWTAASQDDYDALIKLEDALIEGLSAVADVDGHDFGSGEANIFVLTDEPTGTFEMAKRVLEEYDRLATVRAAYRRQKRSVYTVLWPKSLTTFAVA